MDQTEEPERVPEDVLMCHPDMLLPDLQLVGRQTFAQADKEFRFRRQRPSNAPATGTVSGLDGV